MRIFVLLLIISFVWASVPEKKLEVAMKKMEIKAKILKLVQTENSDLPTLPVVVNKIISVASDKYSSTDELAEVISHDQAMTSKLLKLSNSIYYAQKTKVETIKRAITIIGFDEIGIHFGVDNFLV